MLYLEGAMLSRLRIAGAFAIAALTLLMSSLAHADILISPQRVVLDESNRQTVISLHNPGNSVRNYRLEWVERRMSESGEVIALAAGENPRSVTGMVRFSPRRVSIEPGQTQTVRLDYRPPADLAPGEYRSHLRIALEPLEDGSSATEVMRGEQDGMTFRLNALMSFALPVFVRHGQGSVQVDITAVEPAAFSRNGVQEPALNVSLFRTGEFSAYGRLVVYQQLNANAPVEEISEAGGVAMYAEMSRLTRLVPLRPGVQLPAGSWLRVTYEGEGAERGQVFAERVMRIGN